MKFEIETITPDIAVTMLEGNTRNRKMNMNKVDFYAEAMRRGEWEVNGESIKLNGKLLLDGQKRLRACIKANKAFRTLVCRGVPPHAQKTIDTGETRTNAHHLEMMGEKYSTLLASALRYVSDYYSKTLLKRRHLTHIQVDEALAEHPKLREYVALYGATRPITTKSVLSTIHYIFSRIDTTDADIFMDGFTDGAGLKKGSPILALRNRIITNMSADKNKRLRNEQIFEMFIRAWNMYRKGADGVSRLNVLQLKHSEDIPEAK